MYGIVKKMKKILLGYVVLSVVSPLPVSGKWSGTPAVCCEPKFTVVDVTFSKHSMYCEGYFHTLTTLDGSNKLLVDLVICETESGSTHEWFVG